MEKARWVGIEKDVSFNSQPNTAGKGLSISNSKITFLGVFISTVVDGLPYNPYG
jgi:hypothetical protein